MRRGFSYVPANRRDFQNFQRLDKPRELLATPCALNPKREEPCPVWAKPAAGWGRKATGQVSGPTTGLPEWGRRQPCGTAGLQCAGGLLCCLEAVAHDRAPTSPAT